MTPIERRSSISLASIFAMRLLGLFLVLPVFALEAAHYPGGDNQSLIGLAIGSYGLTQALLQLPLGMASDRWGRKRIIILGLLVFAMGSFMAAYATTLHALIAARAIQGAGAISAAITALLADQTRPIVRSKGMALVGMSIGLMFALALIVAPPLSGRIGLRGLFVLTGCLALLCIAITVWIVPPQTVKPTRSVPSVPLRAAWAGAGLRRLHLSVFVLHMAQMAMWIAVPAMLVRAGLGKPQHWHVYLPAVLASIIFLGFALRMERRGKITVVLRLSLGLLLAVQLGLLATNMLHWHSQLWLLGLLFLFFCGFNTLEACLPSLVSRLAQESSKGAALGIYNTMQSMGLFAGGALGGALIQWTGANGLFTSLACLLAVWLGCMWTFRTANAAQT